MTTRSGLRVKSVSGYLPQDLGLYPDLTARQFLDYMALLKGIASRPARRQRIEQVLELVALREAAGRKLKTYTVRFTRNHWPPPK